MADALVRGAVTFLLTLAIGPAFIRFLVRNHAGKNIRIDGPAQHQAKAGTPTMGGLIIIVPALLVNLLTNLAGHESILLPIGVMVAFALLGLYDDWRGLQDRTGYGLLARLKFPWQVGIGLVAAVGLRYILGLGGMAVPTIPKEIDIGWLYVPLAALLIVGFANAVNLTDGLDGLAGGTGAIAYGAFGLIAYLQGQVYLLAFCFTVAGAMLGFLWFNANPAQLFMGDVGAMALGATLATVALMTEQWLLLGLVGLVFVVETLSVMLQVSFFKLTNGRRLFKMAPLHHHLELSGWSEVQVTQRFWLIGAFAAGIGVALALI